MKELTQKLIGGVHAGLLNRGWPDRLGLYFHNVEAGERAAFSETIRRLRSEGYRFVGANEYVRTDTKSGGRVAFLSFDDNYVEWHEMIPLLEELDVQAAFYVNTGPMRDWATDSEIAAYYEDRLRYKGSRTRPLSSAEVRELRDAGHTIGVHTHNHFVLSELPFETAKEEIYICRDHLEQMLGQRMRHFSYPFGMRRHFSTELQSYCLELGFETIARATPGLLHERFDGVTIQRTDWRLGDAFDANRVRMSVDGHVFERLTGRSAVS